MLLIVVGLIGLGGGTSSRAQSSSSADREALEWTLVLDGTPVSWPGKTPEAPLDSVRTVAQKILRHYRREGYYYARLDSATIDTSTAFPEVRYYLHRGPRVKVGRLQIKGADALSTAELRRLLHTHEGAPFDPRQFDADVQAILDRYEELGRPLAQVRVDETILDTTFSARLHLTLSVEEGPELWLKRIDVPDEARTSPGLIARLADLRVGEPLTGYDPEAIRKAVQESRFIRSVDTPKMKVTPKGGAILRIPVEETAPGSFDLALGYLPPSGSQKNGQLVGRGHLLLEHLFGGGRRVDLSLDRRPGQASIVDVSVADPYLFGLPFGVTGRFRGEQRDSTYGERTYGLEVGYQFSRAFEVSGHLRREVVAPGQAGARLQEGRQRIPRSRAFFYGVGVRYESLDRRFNPRRGLKLDVQVDQGQKHQTLRHISAQGDTTRERESLRQERFRGTIRAYVPVLGRQVLVIGGDAAVLRSRAYDRSDLFRIGGATSLRGYDEDRFLGNVTFRSLLEYRVQLDRRSYAYLFGDLGYIERPSVGGAPSSRAWHPGYGLGIQVSTAIGLITTTYALNPDVSTPLDGRIHFGLSVGL